MTNKMVEETARAWGLSEDKVEQLAEWVELKIPEYYRWRVFHRMLRRHYTKPPKTKKEVVTVVGEPKQLKLI